MHRHSFRNRNRFSLNPAFQLQTIEQYYSLLDQWISNKRPKLIRSELRELFRQMGKIIENLTDTLSSNDFVLNNFQIINGELQYDVIDAANGNTIINTVTVSGVINDDTEYSNLSGQDPITAGWTPTGNNVLTTGDQVLDISTGEIWEYDGTTWVSQYMPSYDIDHVFTVNDTTAIASITNMLVGDTVYITDANGNGNPGVSFYDGTAWTPALIFVDYSGDINSLQNQITNNSTNISTIQANLHTDDDVESVSGSLVNNTDPRNPIINVPTAEDINTTITNNAIISDNANIKTALLEIVNALSGVSHTSITNIDLKPTGNPNEFTVEIVWVNQNGVTQTTTDPTPITITGGSGGGNNNNPVITNTQPIGKIIMTYNDLNGNVVDVKETITGWSFNPNNDTASYVKEDGTTDTGNFEKYINRSRIVSGTISGTTITFVRDDGSTLLVTGLPTGGGGGTGVNYTAAEGLRLNGTIFELGFPAENTTPDISVIRNINTGTNGIKLHTTTAPSGAVTPLLELQGNTSDDNLIGLRISTNNYAVNSEHNFTDFGGSQLRIESNKSIGIFAAADELLELGNNFSIVRIQGGGSLNGNTGNGSIEIITTNVNNDFAQVGQILQLQSMGISNKGKVEFSPYSLPATPVPNDGADYIWVSNGNTSTFVLASSLGSTGGGTTNNSDSFANLTDTPTTLGTENQFPVMNAAGTALEWKNSCCPDHDTTTKDNGNGLTISPIVPITFTNGAVGGFYQIAANLDSLFNFTTLSSSSPYVNAFHIRGVDDYWRLRFKMQVITTDAHTIDFSVDMPMPTTFDTVPNYTSRATAFVYDEATGNLVSQGEVIIDINEQFIGGPSTVTPIKGTIETPAAGNYSVHVIMLYK